jgi:uncharacterized protein (TIGR02246 family)
LLLGFSAISALAQERADETAIRTIIKDEIAAWNKGDAVAYGRHFAVDGTCTNILGVFYKGHEAFVRGHDQIFKTIFRRSTLQQDIVSLQFVRPDVAVVDVLTAVTRMQKLSSRSDSLDAKGRLRTRLLQVIAKIGEEWKIVAYHNVEVKDALHTPEPE